MPTYEYACPKCGAHFDQFQSMRDEPLRKCIKCGKTGVKRMIGGGAGLIFKGTGFYITDYKKKTGTPDSGGPESKPAAGAAAAGSAGNASGSGGSGAGGASSGSGSSGEAPSKNASGSGSKAPVVSKS